MIIITPLPPSKRNNFYCHLLGIYFKYFAKHFTCIISLKKELATHLNLNLELNWNMYIFFKSGKRGHKFYFPNSTLTSRGQIFYCPKSDSCRSEWLNLYLYPEECAKGIEVSQQGFSEVRLRSKTQLMTN